MENWKDVNGYEGFYEVSDFGRVRSVSRWVKCKNGSIRWREGKTLKNIKQNTGYLTVHLSRDGIPKMISVQRLVAKAFIGHQPKGAVGVMHLDGTRDNNRVENLRYGSSVCNAAFMEEHGTISRGIARHNAKLDENKIRIIRMMADDGFKYQFIGNQFGVGLTTISAVVRRQNWDWVD